MLHENSGSLEKNIVPKEEQLGFLCSNNESNDGCSSLGFYSPSTEEEAADYLATILVDSYLKSFYGDKK